MGCGTCGEICAQPLLCLFCGGIFCTFPGRNSSSRSQCRNGYAHARSCRGQGVGAYLLLAVTSALIVCGSRYSWSHRLYYDRNGEADINLTRGRPGFLQESHYARLREVLARGGLTGPTSQIICFVFALCLSSHFTSFERSVPM